MPWLVQLPPLLVPAAIGLLGVWLGQYIAKGIAQKTWTRDQKLKIYTDILRSINEYSVWLADTSEGRKFLRGEPQVVSTLEKQNKQIASDFYSAYSVAPLFLNTQSLKLLEEAKPLLSYHSDVFARFEPQELDDTLTQLEAVHIKLLDSAKRDVRAC